MAHPYTTTPVLVAYYRVSTRKQGRSGLGLEAQREIVARYATQMGATVVEHYTEVETGKRTDRPQLQAALAACRLHHATLVVARLDRLARNAAFLLSLRDSGVDLVACDLPAMNRITVGIMAVVAEEEGRAISERTTVALRAAKARGVRLGTPANLSHEGRWRGCEKSAASRREQAARRAKDLAPVIRKLRTAGALSLRELAEALNATGIPTARGCRWTASAVRRVIKCTTATVS